MDKMDFILIPLVGVHGSGKYTLVDGDYDGEYFGQWRWHLNPYTGYVQRGERVDGKIVHIYLHHEVCRAPDGLWRDHINRNKLDNRSCNLRVVTPKESASNRS